MDQTTRVKTKRETAAATQPTGGFEDIILEQMPRLWPVALRFCRHHELDAQDLVQDTMIRAYRYRDSLSVADNKFAWLRRTLLNTHLNRLRSSKRWDDRADLSLAEEIPSFDPMPTSGLVTDAFRKDLWDDEVLRALDSLPEIHRTVLLLADVEGLSREEVAEITGHPKGTVSSYIFRARKKLATVLEQYGLAHGYLKDEDLKREQAGFIEAMENASKMGAM
ncbi:MAG TPA: sigma-70 family RNA polymerase sigma factor [Candidatus Kapabacteria bacterium]|nr:sigma-70 family RNA polymerase sigma factor [Candidatus Kapabacteria bacterium]